MSHRPSPTQAHPLATSILLILACVAAPGCGDKSDGDRDDSSSEGEGEAGVDRSVVTSAGLAAGAAGQAAEGGLGADMAGAAGDPLSTRLGGADPVVPDFGGPQGRLIAGWSGLKPGMKPKELLRTRPRARGSDLTGLVYTETLESPWIAASYRFERLTSNIAHVQWLAGPLASGSTVFRGMSKQGLHRWRRRPRFTEDADHRRAHFDTADGPILLSMANADGRIKLEWRPPTPDGPDPLQAALDQVAGKAPRRTKPAGAGGGVSRPGGLGPGARAGATPTAAVPPRPDGTPPVTRP